MIISMLNHSFFLSVLHKAGRHMEDSMVAAYVGLLIGYIIMKQKVSYCKHSKLFQLINCLFFPSIMKCK